MSCYEDGDIVEILLKGSQTVLGEIKITSKTCPKMFNRLVFFKLELEPGSYSHRKKRSK